MGLKDYAKNFFTNLDQPGMDARQKWTKFARNRFQATVLMKGCCGHPGDPGC